MPQLQVSAYSFPGLIAGYFDNLASTERSVPFKTTLPFKTLDGTTRLDKFANYIETNLGGFGR